MRLLRFEERGKLIITSFAGGNVPPYAILSHTWGPDEDEVTLADLQNDTAKSKVGYSKIEFCHIQAAQHELHYFWIDTCCIDKSSSAELSTAINSMFRWYQQAKRCFAYLADVTEDEHQSWESMFCRSRWFQRGWTLQELIAPSSVEFFSREGRHLGSKKTLEAMIFTITKIPSLAIRSANPSLFPIEERMRWMKGRTTKIEEDMIYCMLGILEVSLPFVYGEGVQNTFMRLQSALDTKKAFDSVFENGTNRSSVYQSFSDLGPEHTSPTHALSTKGMDVLVDSRSSWSTSCSTSCLKALWFSGMNAKMAEIERPAAHTCLWLFDNPQYKQWTSGQGREQHHGLLWLKGNPGVGKSTIMKAARQRIINQGKKDQGSVAAFFFNAKGDRLESTSVGLCQSLLYQLLPKSPTHLQIFSDLVSTKSALSNDEGRGRINAWHINELRELLYNLLMCHSLGKTTVLIDALDECDEHTVRKEAQYWFQVTTDAFEKGVDLAVCISTRPFPTFAFAQSLIIVAENCNRGDIDEYVSQRLSAGMLGTSKWGQEDLKNKILAKASGIFLWATLVVDDLLQKWDEGRNFKYLRKRLRVVPTGLSSLYSHVLSTLDIDERPVALRLFQWATLAVKPLRLHEWHHIMAFIREHKPRSLKAWKSSILFTETQDQLEKQIRFISRGLVEVKSFSDDAGDDHLDHASIQAGAGSLNFENGETRFVQVIHESVREAFKERAFGLSGIVEMDSRRVRQDGHLSILHTCLDYIQIEELDSLVAARHRAFQKEYGLHIVGSRARVHKSGSVSESLVSPDRETSKDMAHDDTDSESKPLSVVPSLVKSVDLRSTSTRHDPQFDKIENHCEEGSGEFEVQSGRNCELVFHSLGKMAASPPRPSYRLVSGGPETESEAGSKSNGLERTDRRRTSTKRKRYDDSQSGEEASLKDSDVKLDSRGIYDTSNGAIEMGTWLLGLPETECVVSSHPISALRDHKPGALLATELTESRSQVLEDFPALLSYITAYFFEHARRAQIVDADPEEVVRRLVSSADWCRWQAIGENVPLDPTAGQESEALGQETYLKSEGLHTWARCVRDLHQIRERTRQDASKENNSDKSGSSSLVVTHRQRGSSWYTDASSGPVVPYFPVSPNSAPLLRLDNLAESPQNSRPKRMKFTRSIRTKRSVASFSSAGSHNSSHYVGTDVSGDVKV